MQIFFAKRISVQVLSHFFNIMKISYFRTIYCDIYLIANTHPCISRVHISERDGNSLSPVGLRWEFALTRRVCHQLCRRAAAAGLCLKNLYDESNRVIRKHPWIIDIPRRNEVKYMHVGTSIIWITRACSTSGFILNFVPPEKLELLVAPAVARDRERARRRENRARSKSIKGESWAILTEYRF